MVSTEPDKMAEGMQSHPPVADKTAPIDTASQVDDHPYLDDVS